MFLDDVASSPHAWDEFITGDQRLGRQLELDMMAYVREEERQSACSSWACAGEDHPDAPGICC